ncbi:WYL domain-containing protein [Desulfovibrio sp.]
MEEEPFEVSVRFAPETATYAAERRWSRSQRCEMHDDGSVTLHIRAHNEAECLSRVLGFADRAQVWPRTGCAGRSKKRSMPWPVCTTRRANRQTRPKAAARLPRPAPCGCGSNPRCRTCVHPYRMFLYQVLRPGHPVRIHAGSSRSVLYLCPAPEGPLGYPCSALP